MRRTSSSAGRRLLAGVIVALPALLLTGALMGTTPGTSLTAGTKVFASTDTPSPSSTDTPSPSPTDTPTPSPSPTPSDTPTPAPTPPPTTSPTVVAPPSLAPVGVVAPPPAPGHGSPPAPQQVSGALVVADPLLAMKVQHVLQHPVAQQRPDLRHFSPPDGAALTAMHTQGGDFFEDGTLPAGPMLVTGGLAAVLLVGAAAVLWVGRSSTRLRNVLALGATALVLPLGAAASTAAKGVQHVTVPAHVPAHWVSALDDSRMPDNALRSHALRPVQRNPTWATLVSIEQAIDRDHQKLVASENAIATYNAMLASPPGTPATPAPATAAASTQPPSAPPSAAAATPTGQPALLKPNLVTLVTNQLGVLVDQHQSLATQYETDLQHEYEFFVSTAQSPQQQNELVQSASLTAPEAASAVAYDINTVQTQLAQEAAIQAAEAAAAATPAPSVTGAFVPSGPITFHAPVGGVVTQSFGPSDFTLEPPVTYGGVFYPHFHTGLDIAAPLDTPVGAAAAGRVILATTSRDANGNYTGYGNYVVIEHGRGFVTLYGHLDQLLVTAGQTVKRGQVIGLLGSTGWSTGPHVHFEVRKDGIFVDPAPYIAKQIRK